MFDSSQKVKEELRELLGQINEQLKDLEEQVPPPSLKAPGDSINSLFQQYIEDSFDQVN